ncbi:MAG: DctP family TRAP transporter solute-binding subunit [Deltaproteobacteria bacterium]|nr:DctP family TRAP transporter solute-binding subunit [Deltaproteobacteria bacterium]
MKRIFVISLALLTLFVLAGPASAQYKATMKLATITPSDHPTTVGGQKFADLIKERTNGRIVIKVYPAMQLGKGAREIFEGVQQGSIELLVTASGPMGGFVPSINITSLPFLFRDYHHADVVLDGPIGRKLLDDFEKANVKGLSFCETGFRNLTNSKHPVKNIEDAKGLKIRVMENKIDLEAWKAAGVNPTPMAWGEVFTALQQKVIDGQENPIAVIHSTKLWDAGQKYFSLTAHSYSPAPLIMCKKTFESMPKEDQNLFLKTALDAAKYQRKYQRDTEEAKLKEIAAKGVTVTRDVDREAFRKAMAPVYDKFSSQFPKADIDAIRNTK